MNKKILIALTLFLSFLTTSGTAAADSPTTTIASPVITVSGSTGIAVISGTFNTALGDIINSLTNAKSLIVLYGPKGDTIPALSSLKPIYCFVSTGTATANFCKISYPGSDNNGSYQATIGPLTGGSYVAIPVYNDNGTFVQIGNNPGVTFTVNATVPSFSLVSTPIAVGMSASVTVNASNLPPEGGVFYLELGNAMSKSGASNFSCILDPSLRSPEINAGHGNSNSINYTFTLPIQGAYCVGLLQKFTGGTIRTPDNTPTYFDNSLFFTAGITPPPGATISGTANKLGCVAGDGNSGYCLLAPLPGIGTNTGYLDVTTGMGNYINMIIRLVLGLIGVLAVFMIIVGGIEYMSTVSLGEKEGAKSRITSALFGLLLALASYIILNTINPNLVNVKVNVPSATIEYATDEGDESNDLSASVPSISGIQVPSDSAQNLAKQILQNGAVKFAVLKDEPAATPEQNIKDTAAGKSATTSIRGDVGVQQVALVPQMLAGILAAANLTPITINEIVGGKHSSNSAHYYGRAFDISASPNDTARNVQIMNACYAAKAKPTQIFGPCSNSYSADGKFTICSSTGYATNKDHQTHIHCGW
jgi:hypothetical protein